LGSNLPLSVKTFKAFLRIFGDTFIKCKILQGISKSETPTNVKIPYWKCIMLFFFPMIPSKYPLGTMGNFLKTKIVLIFMLDNAPGIWHPTNLQGASH